MLNFNLFKRLNNELESRNYELQIKTDELMKLRQQNRELQFDADKLEGKDAHIAKLEARIEDIRGELHRMHQLEK